MTNEEVISTLITIKMLFDNRYAQEALDIAIEALTDKPKGKWIDNGNNWICSNCGVECYVDEDYRPKDKRPMQMNYCHYCGADMKGSDNK